MKETNKHATGSGSVPPFREEVGDAIPKLLTKFTQRQVVLGWLLEECSEMAGGLDLATGSTPAYLDAIYDMLGILIMALMCESDENIRDAYAKYVNAQTARNRQVEGIFHHDIISEMVLKASFLNDPDRDEEELRSRRVFRTTYAKRRAARPEFFTRYDTFTLLERIDQQEDNEEGGE